MQQYFAVDKKDNELILNKTDENHIKNVMRFKPKDEVIVVYNNTMYNCEFTDNLLITKIKNIIKEKNNNKKITAYIPILQEEKMSFIIEKGTEMGITDFIPVQFLRCKYKLKSEAEDKKITRWSRIAKEAAEQSRQIQIPTIHKVETVDTIELLSGVNILCSLDKNNVKPIKQILNTNNVCGTINLLFGPEGGITEEEENKLVEKGFIKTSLGSMVLRTETVIIYLMSIINYLS